jgi:hypothetical protein
MARPTEANIDKAYPSGAYLLDCDGRHDYPRHIYYFYTKKEVIRLWRADHPNERKGK